MTTDGKIKDEKWQYDINRETANKIDKYEYLTCEEIQPSDRSRMIEQHKFPYSPLAKTFEKQTKAKTIEGQEKNKS